MILLISIIVTLLGAILYMFKDYLKYGIVKKIYFKMTGKKKYYMERLYKIKKRSPLLTYRARIRMMRRYILSNKRGLNERRRQQKPKYSC